MVVFLTKNEKIRLDTIQTYRSEFMIQKSINKIFEHCAKKYSSEIAKDYETNGLDAHIHSPLLLALGSPEHQVVIDVTTIDWTAYAPIGYKRFTYIAHNAKFEYKMTMANFNVDLDYWYDTMVVDQRIWQNCPIEFNLVAVCQRNLDKIPEHMLKFIRNDFIGVDPEKFIPEDKHVYYAAADIVPLHEIKDKQLLNIDKYDLNFLVNKIVNPLVPALGAMELRGFTLRTKQLLEADAENKQLLFNLLVRMDEEIIFLRDITFTPRSRKWLLLSGGKYTHKRIFQQKAKQYDLFGGTTTVKNAKIYQANTNYGSTVHLINIFARLGIAMPTKDFQYLVPILISHPNDIPKGTNYKIGNCLKETGLDSNGEIKSHGGFTSAKPAIERYLVDKPTAKINNFLQMLVEHNKLQKEISTYGESMVDKVNKVTGKIHSIYRQCATANGRLASGGGRADSDKINQQNIPRLAKFRTAFATDSDRLMGTTDLSGAEITVMCSNSGDKKLYELAILQDDAHSPLITNSWRAIYLFRAGKKAKLWTNFYGYLKKYKSVVADDFYHTNGSLELYNLSLDFVVSKKVNKPYRQGGKNNNFGSIYGMGAKTAAKTYNGTTMELRKYDPKAKAVNVTVDDAKVALHAIKSFIPTVFEHVESISALAFQQGYLVLNTRTNSRIWFNDVLKAFDEIKSIKKELTEMGVTDSFVQHIENGKYTMNTGDTVEMTFREYNAIDGQARNIPISGTQADMLKEAMVILHQMIKKFNLSIRLLAQIHDEIVFDFLRTDEHVEIDVKYLHINYQGTVPYLVEHVMKVTANLYLREGIEMGADTDIAETWVKP